MSLDSITTDNFGQLTPEAHALAIYKYSQHVALLRRRLQAPDLLDDERATLLDELLHTQTLRKVHVVRLNEQLHEQHATADHLAA
jgi:hypothetical protein